MMVEKAKNRLESLRSERKNAKNAENNHEMHENSRKQGINSVKKDEKRLLWVRR
jgi:hypothetical protein